MEERESNSLHWSFTFLAVGASFGSLGIAWFSFNTVINHLQIVMFVAGIGAISYFPFKKYFRKRNLEMRHIVPLFCLFGFGPVTACLLFALNNYVPYGEEFTEKYHIERILTITADGKHEKKNIITLDKNAYNEYRSIRTFYDRNLTTEDKYVTFTFRRGILGLKQLKHVNFSNN